MNKYAFVKNNSRAFTLIELLVVVAIITTLMAILLPALNNARMQAKTVACASQARQIRLTLSMYADENNGWMPALGAKVSLPDKPSWTDLWWNGVLTYSFKWDGIINNGRISRIFLCPGDPIQKSTSFDFGSASGNGSYGVGDSYFPGYGYDSYKPTRIALVPQDGILFGDNVYRKLIVNTATSYMPNQNNFWHGGKLNYAFGDGHVEPLTFGQLLNTKDNK